MRKFQETHFININFSTLIVTDSNVEVVAMAKKLLSQSISEWGMIVIHSQNSFGKTHLIGALGNELLTKNPHVGIYVVDVIFKREDWRVPVDCNLVIVDGIGPLLSGETEWQMKHLNSLIEIVDHCHVKGIAIILTADSFYLNHLPVQLAKYLWPSNILEVKPPNMQHLKEIGRLFASTLMEDWFQICEQDIEAIVESEDLPRAVQARLSLLKYVQQLHYTNNSTSIQKGAGLWGGPS